MSENSEPMLDKLLAKVSQALTKGKQPVLKNVEITFLENAQHIVLPLIERLARGGQEQAYKNACLGFLAQALSNLRYHYERDEVWAKRLYNDIDTALSAQVEHLPRDSLLGIQQVFYEARLEVPANFKALSLDKFTEDKGTEPPDEAAMREHGQAMIASLFAERPDLTVFELTDFLFESMHALPAEAAYPMIICLADNQHPVAQEAPVLFLLHPNPEVREIAIDLLSKIYAAKPLPPASLRRLVTIRQWSPAAERPAIDSLIAGQRKLANQFADIQPSPDIVRYEASLFDGSGVQMISFTTRQGKRSRFGGFLVKHEIGIRDAWITPAHLPEKELRTMKSRMQKANDLTMLPVNEDYVAKIVSHYIALNNSNNETPEPHLLEIYEHLGVREWRAELTSLDTCLSRLLHEISPDKLPEDWIEVSLERSGDWADYEDFTRSWFETSPSIDALISRHMFMEKGRPNIRFNEALSELSTTGFEYVRQKWLGLFVWMALMAKSHPEQKSMLLWQDFATLAHVLRQGKAMRNIPLMWHMMYDSLSISIDSLTERGNHLQ